MEPRRSPWYPLWEQARALIDTAGREVSRVCVGLPGDTWLAPLYRSGTEQQLREVELKEFAERRSLAGLLAEHGCESLITVPRLAHSLDFHGIWAAPTLDPLTRARLVIREAGPGHPARPTLVGARGVWQDGWTATRAEIWLANWTGERFSIRLDNATPLDRHIVLRSRAGTREIDLPRGAAGIGEVEVFPNDTVSLEVAPPFHPTSATGAQDERELGIWLPPPSIQSVEGIFRDGWTAPVARLHLADWSSHQLALELGNPTDLEREIEARSGAGTVRLRVEPGSTAALQLDVLTDDHVDLRVAPPFSPGKAAKGVGDERELGVLLGPRPDLATTGVSADGWTEASATFRLEHWLSGVFELPLENPTPLARTVRVRATRQWSSAALAAGATIRLALPVLATDTVILDVSPPFEPAMGEAGFPHRNLGLRLGPPLFPRAEPILPTTWTEAAPRQADTSEPRPIVEAEGLLADGWISTRAHFRLKNWTSGLFELDLENPSPRERRFVARSSREVVRLVFAPGARRHLAIRVGAEDRVVLEVSPPYVPASESVGSEDRRELGLLVQSRLQPRTERIPGHR